jgi:predicted transcriptional regulator of viral defense system
MPINIDRFEDMPIDALDIKEGTQSHTILTFLATNDEQAFTQSEIHDATEIPRGSACVVLSRLENRELVRHRGRYWAITEDERLASYAAQQATSSSSTSDNYYSETDE